MVQMAPQADEPEHDVRPDLHLVADSDGALLCRIAERDLEAFANLYRRYVRPVYGLALRRLSDRGRAEDATEEAFVAIWRSAATYVPERGGGARWLFRVARNTIVDHAQSRSHTGLPDCGTARARHPGARSGGGGRGRLAGVPCARCRGRAARAGTRAARARLLGRP